MIQEETVIVKEQLMEQGRIYADKSIISNSDYLTPEEYNSIKLDPSLYNKMNSDSQLIHKLYEYRDLNWYKFSLSFINSEDFRKEIIDELRKDLKEIAREFGYSVEDLAKYILLRFPFDKNSVLWGRLFISFEVKEESES